MKTDTGIYQQAALSRPKVGETATDPVFSTPIKRLTNADQTTDTAWADGRMVRNCQVEYSSVCPFNADGSYMLLLHGTVFQVYRGDGSWFFEPRNEGKIEVLSSSEPRWSATEPGVFYYLRGNEIRRYSIASRSATSVRIFTEYVSATNKGVAGLRAMGEQDISEKGRICLAGTLPNGSFDVFVYDFKSGAKSPVMNFGSQVFDNLYATPDGNVTIGFYATGKGSGKGEWLYSPEMRPVRQLAGAMGHKDVGRDVSQRGDEVLIWACGANTADMGGQICKPNGVERIDLADGSRSCVLALNWDMSHHTYVPQSRNGFALVSTYTPDASKPWAPYTNEIIIASMDGSSAYRLAHHRAMPFSYTRSPRATGNRDLSKIVFNSGWGSPDLNYCDVYMIELDSATPRPVEPAPVQESLIPVVLFEGQEWVLKLRVENGKLVANMFDVIKS